MIGEKQILMRDISVVIVRRVWKAVEPQRSIEPRRRRGDGERALHAPRGKDGCPSRGGHRREAGCVEITRSVGRPPAPSCGTGPLGDGCLPLILLIRMREEVGRNPYRSVPV